jgi:hypothetical protein
MVFLDGLKFGAVRAIDRRLVSSFRCHFSEASRPFCRPAQSATETQAVFMKFDWFAFALISGAVVVALVLTVLVCGAALPRDLAERHPWRLAAFPCLVLSLCAVGAYRQGNFGLAVFDVLAAAFSVFAALKCTRAMR